LSGNFQTVIDVVCVGVRLSGSTEEAAELAIGVTDVCRIEMAIDIEVGRAAVSSSSHDIGQFAESRQIVSGIKRDSVCEGEPFAICNACCYLVESFIV